VGFRRTAVIALVPILGACSLFTSLGGLSDDEKGAPVEAGAPAVDGGSVADGAAPDSPSSTDATTTDPYAAAVLALSPLVYYRFVETAGRIATDATGRHDGEYKGTVQLGVAGAFAGSRAFRVPPASAAHVSVATSELRFAGRAPYSVELWVQPATFEDYQWIVSTERAFSPRRGWSILANANARPFYEMWNQADDGGFGTGGRSLANEPIVLRANAWTYLVYTYDGTTIAVFVDGARVGGWAQTADAPDVGDALTIGCRFFDGNPGGCFDGGTIDEVAIYGRALVDA
jgi:hypothetical protein